MRTKSSSVSKDCRMSAKLESLLMQLGSPGRYSLLVVMLLQLNVFWYLVTFFTLSLWNYSPRHHCTLLGNSSLLLLNETLPGEPPYDQCHMYLNPSNHSLGVTTCQNGYTFDAPQQLLSIAMEWNLLCDEKYMFRVLQTCFLVGAVVGGVFGGALADKYGRRPMTLVSLYTSMVLSIVAALAPHPYAFAAAKFLQGAMVQACMACSTSLKIELLPTRYRTITHAIGEVVAATMCVLHIVLSIYVTQDWRYIEYFNVLPMALTLGNIWIVPESIRWLLKTKQEEKAMATIQRIARFNGVQLPSTFKSELQSVMNDIENENLKAGNASLKELFRQKTLALYTIVFMSNWISGTFLGMGVVLSFASMSGSLLINYLIMAASVFIMKTLFFTTALKFGRRITITMAFVTAGIAMLFAVLNTVLLEWDPLISIISGTTARGCVSSLMSISFLYVAEIFPTELRTFAQGCCSGAGRIGSMLVPLALLVGDYSWDWLPFIVFGVCGLISGTVTQILPETRNRPMPNNVQDTLNMKRKKAKEPKKLLENNAPI